MRDVAIDRIMTTNPVTVAPDDPATTAKELLDAGRIHHLPVVENDKLVGIISTADLLRICLYEDHRESASDLKIRKIMSANPVVLESGASLRDAAKRLLNGGYHSLPIVNADGSLAGIVTSVDLVEHLFRQLPSGDGSMQEPAGADPILKPDDGDFVAVLRAAKEAASADGSKGKLAQILLYLKNRNRMLEDVCKAAELYIRSGYGEHEHTVLVKRLGDLRNNDSTTL